MNDNIKYQTVGNSCGVNNPNAFATFVSVFYMITMTATVLVGLHIDLTPLQGTASLFGCILFLAFGFPRLANIAIDRVTIRCGEKHIEVQSGRTWPFISVEKIDYETIEIIDAEKWQPNPRNRPNLFYYRVRAHLKDGRFIYLMHSKTVRFKSREAARKLNEIVGMKNKMLIPADQSTARRRHASASTEPSPAGVPDMLGRVPKAQLFFVAFISLFIYAAICLVAYGAYQLWH